MQPREMVGGHRDPAGPGLLPLHRAKLRKQPPDARIHPSPIRSRLGAEARTVRAAVQPSVRQHAHDEWNAVLGRVQITGGTAAQQSTFYTALYHAMLHPNVFNDVNGQYRGMDQAVHTISGSQGAQYANFSGLDI